MKKNKKLEDLEKLIESYKKIHDDFDKLYELFGCGGTLSESVFTMLERYIDLYETHNFNSDISFITWFIYDNDYGKKGYKAGYGKKLKPIKTVKDLYNILTYKGDVELNVK
jgi:endonuclease IV